jgi:hypothetical protein
MFVVDLVCTDGHLFEGWYDNKDAFDDARAEGGLSCPVCGNAHVELKPSFKGIVRRRSAAPAPATPPASSTPATTSPPPPPLPLEVQRALSQLVKFVRAHTEDAGDAFAKRALAMHRGEEEPAPIHGTTTPAEREELLDEGVPFAAIPIPEIDQN